LSYEGCESKYKRFSVSSAVKEILRIIIVSIPKRIIFLINTLSWLTIAITERGNKDLRGGVAEGFSFLLGISMENGF